MTRQLPKAFTEKGLYMLATILKSPQAVETTIAIVEAYAKLKELSRVIIQVPQQTATLYNLVVVVYYIPFVHSILKKSST